MVTNADSSYATRLARNVLGLALVAFFCSACGPILSTQQLADARRELDRAASVEADDFATYEYVSASEYLDKAEEEWGFSDFQQALEYAERASDFAQRAYERAVRNPRRGAPVIENIFDEL